MNVTCFEAMAITCVQQTLIKFNQMNEHSVERYDWAKHTAGGTSQFVYGRVWSNMKATIIAWKKSN